MYILIFLSVAFFWVCILIKNFIKNILAIFNVFSNKVLSLLLVLVPKGSFISTVSNYLNILVANEHILHWIMPTFVNSNSSTYLLSISYDLTYVKSSRGLQYVSWLDIVVEVAWVFQIHLVFSKTLVADSALIPTVSSFSILKV